MLPAPNWRPRLTCILTLTITHSLFLTVFLLLSLFALCFEKGPRCMAQDDLELTAVPLHPSQSARIVGRHYHTWFPS